MIGLKIQKALKKIENSSKFGHYKFIFSKPLDTEKLDLIAKDYDTVITFEDGIENGGFGDVVLNHLAKINFKGKFIKKLIPMNSFNMVV